MGQQPNYDILIIGSGAAGLSLALNLPESLKIAIVSKARLRDGCTSYAQGGISAVLDPADSVADHVRDTCDAGAGLCREDIVRFTAEQGKSMVDWLVDLGMKFTRETEGGQFHLTQEGGHSHRRVIHVADATGRALESTLLSHVEKRKNINAFERHLCVDLITSRKLGIGGNRCLGAYVSHGDRVIAIGAKVVVIATGGAGKVYLYTSNPDVSSGDGIAIGWRAGCRVANLEFVQFHPTCLFHPRAKSYLITEALRGEGARLKLPDGQFFMDRFDPRGELAPRDIVARAIDHEMKRLGSEYVCLDISHKPADFIREHFPNAYQRCLEFGYDMTKESIPVVPAAHYTCGGLMTDRHGRTDVPGLYAIGEVAHTGLHGANRMASNSLLECLVFAHSAARDISGLIDDIEPPPLLPEWDESRVTNSDEAVVVTHNWHELRRFMWDYVGIVRTTKRLERARHRIDLLVSEINEYYGNFKINSDLIELRNLVQVADLIVRCATLRQESRGLHYTLDFPQTDAVARDTILIPLVD